MGNSTNRKLTVEQVLEARLRYASGERQLSKLSRDYEGKPRDDHERHPWADFQRSADATRGGPWA